MTIAKPSLELLRTLTDEHVLRELMRARRLTRADLAARSGLSKPTVGESVRRLTEAGLVVDTGERTPGGRGRGRVGSYYALADTVGTALAISIAPDGVAVERIGAHGDVLGRTRHDISRPARAEQVADALRTAVAQAREGTGDAIRLAVVSAADPVERASGRLVRLPDAPFLLGDLDPVEVLTPQVAGPVVVDNDVNWAAQAERDTDPTGLGDFAYVFLGEGLGCAIVSDGEVRRGHSGVAGEIAHLVTIGPRGQATRFIDVFADLDLRRAGTTAIDVDRVRQLAGADRQALGQAVSGVLAAIVALTDPRLVLIGGPWGSHPAILDAVTTAFTRMPRHVEVRPARLTEEPSLAGARAEALDRLRSAIIALPQRTAPSAPLRFPDQQDHEFG
ncbi:ROK family transcriptional regulator [Micromonospora sp. NBC_01638]|uniref:ROK family transcriptional regulator n=1 Tax=Micromonospora sp. NBC_01638 TaxID=2975982 RepID=UPI0038677B50|nr:ROK family transcriptional regulator [Micromonospora sp. NBC_01638]